METVKIAGVECRLHGFDDFVLLNEIVTRIVADLSHHENGRKCLTPAGVKAIETLCDAISGYKAANV